MKRVAVVMLLVVMSGVSAWGAGQAEVSIQLTAQRIFRNAQGKESVASGDTAKPGEILEYRAVYRNRGTAAAHKLLGTLPVPEEMEFVPDSAVPAAAQASTDRGAITFAPAEWAKQSR